MFELQLITEDYWIQCSLSTKYFGFIVVLHKHEKIDIMLPKLRLDDSLFGVLNICLMWQYLWIEVFFGKEPPNNVIKLDNYRKAS